MITAPHFHAMVIHFPIALLLAGFLSELIALFSKKQFFKNASGGAPPLGLKLKKSSSLLNLINERLGS